MLTGHLFVAEFAPVFANPGLDVALGTMLAFGVALGLIYIVDVFLRAFFGFAEDVTDIAVGWVPVLGKLVKHSISAAEQKATNLLGQAAHNLEGHIGDAFHAAANQMQSVGHEIYGLSVSFYHLVAYLEGKIGMQILLPTLRHEQKLTAADRKRIAEIQRQQHATQQQLAHANSGKLGAAIHSQTRPIAHRTTWIDTHELPGIRARQRAAERAIPNSIAGLREHVIGVERGIDTLWSKVKHLDRVTTGALASALVATALGRLGAGWFRCSNWRKIGNRVCRTDPSLIEELLLGTLAIVGTLSITEFARELQGEMQLASDGIHKLVRE